jgi:hypothetical protein
MVDLITKRRLFKLMDLERFAESEPRRGVIVINGKIVEWDNVEGGTRTLRDATEMDVKIFEVLSKLETV